MKKNIAVEGVMGVGKTTLVNALRSNFDIEAVEQDFEHNICLDDFYASMDCAFQKQMIFLYSNYHLLMKAQSAFAIVLFPTPDKPSIVIIITLYPTV